MIQLFNKYYEEYSNDKWDFLLDGWTSGWESELYDFIKNKIDIDREEYDKLFKRWQTYFFLWFDPWEGWGIQKEPYKTYTIEQFKQEFGTELLIKKESGLLKFRCGWIDGVIYNSGMPINPVVSKFSTTSIHEGWMIHDAKMFI